MFGTGRGIHPKVWDGSKDSQGGPGQVGGPTLKSETGWWTLVEVRDVSRDPRGGLGWVGGTSGTSGLVGGPTQKSGTVGGPS